MRDGLLGAMLVGVILLISGISYLDDIMNYPGAMGWERLAKEKAEDYRLKTELLLRKEEVSLFDQGITEFVREAHLKKLKEKIETGRIKLSEYLAGINQWQSQHILMQHPAKFFILLLVSEWLLVAGIGCIIMFSWSRWFVFLSILLALCWQSYLFIYERTIREALIKCDASMYSLLNIPLGKPPTSSASDAAFAQQALYTFIFLGLLFYLSTRAGRKQFGQRKDKKTLAEFFAGKS